PHQERGGQNPQAGAARAVLGRQKPERELKVSAPIRLANDAILSPLCSSATTLLRLAIAQQSCKEPSSASHSGKTRGEREEVRNVRCDRGGRALRRVANGDVADPQGLPGV